jgi:hypothetical protein
MPNLTCYRLRTRIRGHALSEFDHAVDLERYGDRLEQYGPVTGPDFSAKLYMLRGYPHPPAWVGFLQEGFGSDMDPIPEMLSLRAVLLVQVDYKGEESLLAFTFGRHLEPSCVPGHGSEVSVSGQLSTSFFGVTMGRRTMMYPDCGPSKLNAWRRTPSGPGISRIALLQWIHSV